MYDHDWKILLDHEPVKHLIKQWKGGRSLPTQEQYIKVVSDALAKMGPNQCMHYGILLTTTTNNINKAPSYLLTILWLL